MSRILLVDDSPHAQRMGERILSDEGYEVVTVSNSDSALIRLDDVDPDVVLADTVMPGRTGFEICQYLKMSPRHRHVRVILTAGVLEPLDEAQVKRVEADGTLRKPFEASALLAAVKPLAEAATAARAEATNLGPGVKGRGAGGQGIGAIVPFVAVVDAEQVRAAVTVALDASMGTIVDEIAGRVLAALNTKKSAGPALVTAPARPEPPTPAAPPPAFPLPPSPVEPVRRVSPLKIRSTSILGLEVGPPEPESPASELRTFRSATRTEGTRPAPETRSASAVPQPPTHSRFGEPDPQPPALGPRLAPDARSAAAGPQPPTHSRFGEPDPQSPALGPRLAPDARSAAAGPQPPTHSRFGEPDPQPPAPDPQPPVLGPRPLAPGPWPPD